ncbi:MAG TPA: type III pantothenate kinase [Edaphocola sp.]|nr:type III pantothenate kinase [Edaphocola sp.]
MNLCIDFGNTACKVALVQDENILNVFQFEKKETLQALEDIIGTYQPQKVILSSVIDFDRDIEVYLKNNCKQLIILDTETPLPFLNAYLTENKLGTDRIALAAAGLQQFPGNNCLIISIGTAITYNFISQSKVFRGGAISPGPRLRFESLHTKTDKLPLIEDMGYAPIIGFDTESCIKSGVINGIAGELNYIINEYQNTYPDLKVVVTGGYLSVFENKIKNQIFADSKFIFRGLNLILNHNAF